MTNDHHKGVANVDELQADQAKPLSNSSEKSRSKDALYELA